MQLLSGFLQAFCLPILQIVYETLLDQREGKGGGGGKRTGQTGD